MAIQLPQNVGEAVGAAGAGQGLPKVGGPTPTMAPDPGTVPTPGATPPAGAPAGDAGPSMSHEQMVADLEGKTAALQGKNAELNAKSITRGNKLDNMRTEIMQNLFALLEKNGIDPNDPESLRSFLEQLAETDPDLFEIFETAFVNLSPEGGEAAPTGEETPPPEVSAMLGSTPAASAPTGEDQGLMGKFKNLAGGVMR